MKIDPVAASLLSRQHPMYNGGELRWQQPNPGPGGSYLAYPILSSPQPPVSNDYAYYQIMPAPCPPVMGFYQPFPGTYAGPVQAGVVNPVSADVTERPLPLGPHYGMASPRMRGMVRPNVLSKVLQTLQEPLQPLLMFFLRQHFVFSGFISTRNSWVCVSLRGAAALQPGMWQCRRRCALLGQMVGPRQSCWWTQHNKQVIICSNK